MKTQRPKQIIAILLITGLLFASCEDMWNHHVDGNGEHRSENRTLQEFSRIELNGDFEIQLDTSEIYSATIEADENLLEFIETRVSGDLLIVEPRHGTSLRPSHTIEITLTAPKVSEIILNGSGLLYCYALETEALSVNLAGSGKVECFGVVASLVDFKLEGSGIIVGNLFAENVTTILEGSGEIRLSGECVTADHEIIGSGKIKAGQLQSNVCSSYISGSGSVDVLVNSTLQASITGSGIVYYSGSPQLETRITGSGKVIKR